MIYLMIAKKLHGVEWRITDNPLNKDVLVGVGLSNPTSQKFLKYGYSHVLENVVNFVNNFNYNWTRYNEMGFTNREIYKFVNERFTKLAKEWAADYGSDYIYLM